MPLGRAGRAPDLAVELRGADRATPPPIDAAPPELRVTLEMRVEQAVPGTDVLVTLSQTRPGQPREEYDHALVEREWPKAIVRLRRVELTLGRAP